MLRVIHPIAGTIGFLIILTFWTSTVYSEIIGSPEMVSSVKAMVLKGMFILIPAMIIVGASGMTLGRHRKDATTLAKKKRMPFIAGNGLFVLVPAAFYLNSKASAGDFDSVFYAIQTLELIAGAINISLMGMSIRDGRRMGQRRRKNTAK